MVRLCHRYYELAVHPSLATILLCALTAYGVVSIMWTDQFSWFEKIVSYTILIVVYCSWINSRHRRDQRAAQSQRNARAREIAEGLSLKRTPPPVFTLYLRPFSSTDRLATQGGHSPYPDHVDLETIMARSLRRTAPLIALGSPRDIAEGAGRVGSSEAEWFDRFQTLAQAAKLIVMIPSAQAGTIREMKFLVEHHLLSRTVFVMPEDVTRELPELARLSYEDTTIMPGRSVESNPEAHRTNYRAAWLQAVESAGRCGLTLPPYAPMGALFNLGMSGMLNRAVPLCLILMRPRRRPLLIGVALDYLQNVMEHHEMLECFVASAQKDARTRAVALHEGAALFSRWNNDAVSRRWATQAESVHRTR
jgi:hypothetical protein